MIAEACSSLWQLNRSTISANFEHGRTMPKSRIRKGRKLSGGSGLTIGERSSPAKRRRQNVIIAVTVTLVAAAIGTYWWISSEAERDFLAIAAEGNAALSGVKNERSLGGGHLRPGQTRTYPSRFPTSGSHHSVPTEPGFYENRQSAIELVHALEHGHIVIYYDKPGANVLETIRRWTRLYSGQWGGIVATPMSRLGRKIVLTAWTKRLDQARFDTPAAAAFIDAYRGRGPEKPIR